MLMIDRKNRIIDMESHHVDGVVDVHMAAFPGFFLTFLGRQFLREFYREFVRDTKSITLIAEDPSSEKLLGFAVGNLDPAGFFSQMVSKRWWVFAIASLPALAKNPKYVVRLIRALGYRGDVPKDMSRTLLSSISVLPELRRTGLGSILLKEWVEKARLRGSRGCYLTTDAADNDAVNQFYIRNGWEKDLEYVTPEGRKMCRYIINF